MADVTDEDRERARALDERVCVGPEERLRTEAELQEWRTNTLAAALAAERDREAASWQERFDVEREALVAINEMFQRSWQENDRLRALLARVREALRAPWCSSRDRALIAAIDAALGEKP